MRIRLQAALRQHFIRGVHSCESQRWHLGREIAHEARRFPSNTIVARRKAIHARRKSHFLSPPCQTFAFRFATFSSLYGGGAGRYGGILGGDGCIYGIPHTAKKVLRIDPRTDTVSTLGSLAGGAFQVRFCR